MQHTVTIKKNHEFRRLYSKGRSFAAPSLVLYARPNRQPINRIGFTVTVKLGHAVIRNRIRRRLREIYRLHENELKCGQDLIVVARSRAVDAAYADLERDFLYASEKLGLREKMEGQL